MAAASAAQGRARGRRNLQKRIRNGALFWLALFVLLGSCGNAREVDLPADNAEPLVRRLRRHRHESSAGAAKAATKAGGDVGSGQTAGAGGSWIWERRRGNLYSPAERACKVFCEGELLDAVQTTGIFQDSKEFVDMPMRQDPEVILEKFNALSPRAKADRYEVSKFINAHFLPPGSELLPVDPIDFTETPAVLDKLAPNSTYYKWAQALNVAFKQLTRRVSEDVDAHPQRYSLLQRRHAVVIPGGRFRESYYWDSYWIVLGLLACEMKDTARGLVQNLLDDVANFGFVPNGGRIYYLNRSQPPLLSEMVLALLEADSELRKDQAFINGAVRSLDAEYEFWMREGEHAVQVEDAAGRRHVLNRYWTRTTYPRPESYKEDLTTSDDAPLATKRFGGVFANIAAGAESGWDFSSRWIVPNENGTYTLSDIETTNILPVELNAFLYRMERNLARLHELQATAADVLLPATFAVAAEEAAAEAAAAAAVDKVERGAESEGRVRLASPEALAYALAADRRALAMDIFMWSDSEGMWVDHLVAPPAVGERKGPGAGVVSASNFIPLWANLLANPVVEGAPAKALAALASLKATGLVQVGGVQTTLRKTAEQWDAPNAWPPIQQIMIEGLESLGLPEASEMAATLAKGWLESNYLGWATTGYMHEKYNALVPGARGEGGEYYPQVGFGWTNGVVLHLLNTYGESLSGGAGATAGVADSPAVPEAPAVQLESKRDQKQQQPSLQEEALAVPERRQEEEGQQMPMH